jgi:hypothetical protein
MLCRRWYCLDSIGVSFKYTYIYKPDSKVFLLDLLSQMKSLLIASLFLLSIQAAPFGDVKQINILNQCDHSLQIGHQTNDGPRGPIVQLDADKSYQLTVKSDWAGRVWAKGLCDAHMCDGADADHPVSLAEFKLSSLNTDIDYYDVSFVDGFNFPVRIVPQIVDETDTLVKLDDKHCSISECTALPTCPLDLQLLDSIGKFIACESACSKYREDKYCCTGAHGSAKTCTSNHYADEIKKKCPDSYSYAFDDATSVYGCRANAYQVVFCPRNGTVI